MSILGVNVVGIQPVAVPLTGYGRQTLLGGNVTLTKDISIGEIVIEGAYVFPPVSIPHNVNTPALVQTNKLVADRLIGNTWMFFGVTTAPLVQTHALSVEPNVIHHRVTYSESTPFEFWHALHSEDVTYNLDIPSLPGEFWHALAASPVTAQWSIPDTTQQQAIGLVAHDWRIQYSIFEFFLVQGGLIEDVPEAPLFTQAKAAQPVEFPFKCISPKSSVLVIGGNRSDEDMTGYPTLINWQDQLRFEITIVLEALTPKVANTLIGYCSTNRYNFIEFTFQLDGKRYRALLDNLPILKPIYGGFYYDTVIKLRGTRI